MRFLRLTALASFVVAAVAVGAGTSYAQPAPTPIGYEVKLVDKTIVTTLDNGRFDVAADQRSVDIEDAAGNTVLTLPLSFALDDVAHPYGVALRDDDRVLELTPDMDPAKASPSLLRPTASLLENQRAQQAFATQFGIATAIGSFTGLVVGALVGALVGVPIAGVCAGLTAGLCIIAAIPIIAATASIGAIIGTIVVGGPALVIAGVDLVQTLTAPPGTTKWNYAEPQPAG
ncbi:MAG TPA: ammonium transporter [Aldersonia sp.]